MPKIRLSFAFLCIFHSEYACVCQWQYAAMAHSNGTKEWVLTFEFWYYSLLPLFHFFFSFLFFTFMLLASFKRPFCVELEIQDWHIAPLPSSIMALHHHFLFTLLAIKRHILYLRTEIKHLNFKTIESPWIKGM